MNIGSAYDYEMNIRNVSNQWSVYEYRKGLRLYDVYRNIENDYDYMKCIWI